MSILRLFMELIKPLTRKKEAELDPFAGINMSTPEDVDAQTCLTDYRKCDCFNEYYIWENRFDGVESDKDLARMKNTPMVWPETAFHVDPPSQSQRAWDIACEIIDITAKKDVKELNLGKIMDRHDYMALNTLPETIGECKALERLVLYGSNISSIPREISGCVSLKAFEPYTSYRLHWFPYEMTKCRHLSNSCISTRALYGNYKIRPPFPNLSIHRWEWPTGKCYCSVCGGEAACMEQYWTTQPVAADVIPLLVSVCSNACLEKIGDSPKDYIKRPHRGGLQIEQPEAI
ncbi:MAG: leucine-rich repeat domain-containing protein [Planctomycetes bacterium]|nr:leucine-rich repeat domain-containing protein [Planctomycetota bacterium]